MNDELHFWGLYGYICECDEGFTGDNCEIDKRMRPTSLFEWRPLYRRCQQFNLRLLVDQLRRISLRSGRGRMPSWRSLRQRPMSQLTGQLQLFVRERRWLRTSDYSYIKEDWSNDVNKSISGQLNQAKVVFYFKKKESYVILSSCPAYQILDDHQVVSTKKRKCSFRSNVQGWRQQPQRRQCQAFTFHYV